MTRNKDWNQILQESHDNYSERVDTTTTTNTVYEGRAILSDTVSTASPIWQIKRTNTSTLVITWADGNDAFDNVWDNRASLSYS